MRKLAILILIILALMMAQPVFASDISTANWHGILRVTNSGNSTISGASANFSLNTASMISNGYLNSTASDATVQYNGIDVAFQPGLGTNPWAVFVPTIGSGQNVNFDIYTDTVTGGKIRYFPGSTGMVVSDNANLELGSNFYIEAKGYFDTSSSAVSGNIASKSGAISVMNYPGKITTQIADVTYPEVGASSNGTSNGTSFVVTYPAGYEAGDLLLIAASANRTAISPTLTAPSGFTQMYQFCQSNQIDSGFWYKIATGSEGASGTWTSSNTTDNAWIALRVLKNTYVGNPVSANASGGASNPNPPSLTTGWGSVPTLWLAVAGSVAAQAGAPTDYSNWCSVGGLGYYINSAEMTSTAASENPGTYGTSSTTWVAGTIGIQGGFSTSLSSGEHTVKVALEAR